MKTLVIHPEDKTTEFLLTIYANITDITVVKGRARKSEILDLIKTHDRVIMLGHGAQFGLMNPGQFTDSGMFIIDGSMANSLKNKSNCIYIWCYADQFVKRYGLSGLCSGMFISEVGEAYMEGFHNIERGLIDQSNATFSSVLSKYINEPLDAIYRSLLNEYEELAQVNPIARFNFKRLQLIAEAANHNHFNRLNNEYLMGVRAEDTEEGVC